MSVSAVQLRDGRVAHFCADGMKRLQGLSLRLNGASQYVETSVKLNGRWRTVLAHRLVIDAQPGQVVDHINGDRLDNRLSNLRIVSHRQNATNRAGFGAVESAGVRRNGDQFVAFVNPNGRQIYLGSYTTEEEAASAYRAAASVVFGQYSRSHAEAGDHSALERVIQMKRDQINRLQDEINQLTVGGRNAG